MRCEGFAEPDLAPKRVKQELGEEMPLAPRPQPEACKLGGWQWRLAKANAQIESLQAERGSLIHEVNRLGSALVESEFKRSEAEGALKASQSTVKLLLDRVSH